METQDTEQKPEAKPELTLDQEIEALGKRYPKIADMLRKATKYL